MRLGLWVRRAIDGELHQRGFRGDGTLDALQSGRAGSVRNSPRCDRLTLFSSVSRCCEQGFDPLLILGRAGYVEGR